ncbi:Acyl dehydratase [Albimonas donghaensis]|uniref:Acyl dehydratase n=1 Tax=Albimonas donghaensis TaxID=356660 RepID=A0A1H3DVL5_9RHOB|nr:MaoC family dehydratase [Albimonas donghaensis]SDX69724.1 Acyl dehydratase [Albimonas donghaensis]
MAPDAASIPALTGPRGYFEDFAPGALMRHARGKTIEPLENVLITNMTLNTAAVHFDKALMKDTPSGRRVVYGGVTASLVVGLSSQDCSEKALADLEITGLRLKSPVYHGDTIYAFSEVLETAEADRADAGVVSFRHWGVNQDDVVVCEMVRRCLIRRRLGAEA